MVFSLILCFSAAFAGLAFDLPRACLHLEDSNSSSEASEILWNWILKRIRLSEAYAALHDIYKKDCAAVFFDLNSDGENEILGPHYASARNGNGEWLLYVLQKDKNGKYKEITGDTVYFDAKHPICILLKKTDGYRNFQVYSETKDDDVTYVYNKEKGLYYKKSVKN